MTNRIKIRLLSKVRVGTCYCCRKKLVEGGYLFEQCYRCETLSFFDVQEGLIARLYERRESLGKSCIAATLVRSTEVAKAKRARASQIRYDNLCKARKEKRWPYQLGDA